MMEKFTRRRLLECGAALAGLASLNPARSLAQPQIPPARQFTWHNWAGNLHSEPQQIAAPASEQAIIELLKTTSGNVRPAGSGHSWSALVPTDGIIVGLDRLMGLISDDPQTLQCEVWAGTKLFLFGPMLEAVGQAMINMPDINYQSLAGLVATSTHGTGRALGSMSSYVVGLRLLTPGGEVLDCDANNNAVLLQAGITSLGSLGIISRLRLQNREAHRLHQQEWLAPTEQLMEQVDQLNRDNQQFELFPIPNSERTVVVITNVADAHAENLIEDDPGALLKLRDAFEKTRKIPVINNFIYNRALDFAYGKSKHRIGASYDVLVHPRHVTFAEMEYSVPAEHGTACLREVLATIEKHAPAVCFPLECRFVKGDESLIGMFSERDSCSISVHQFMDRPDWRGFLATVEPVFHKYQGRPHWGKWHSLTARQLAPLYPRWQQFHQLRSELDPKGRMLNPYLRALFGAS